MSFNTIPVEVAGGSYQSKTKPLSSQRSVNFYPQATPQAKEQFVLMPFLGLKPLSSGAGIDRGLHRMSQVLYQVLGNKLVTYDRDFNATELGDVAGEDRCIMANDGENLFIVCAAAVYHYSVITGLLNIVTDSNIVGAKSVAFINNQFIYTKDKLSVVSNVGDGTTADGLNAIGEESLPDKMVRDFIFDDIIYRCGERSVVAWYNSGVGKPPIEKLQGRIFQIGLAAKHSIARTDEAFYWLGDDFSIYQSNAGAKNKISTDAMSYAISKFTNISDAYANTFVIDGMNYYSITFPSENRTYVLSESLGKQGWFDLESADSGYYQGSSFIDVYNQTVVADSNNGKLYKLDDETFTNDGELILRSRTTGTVNGDLLGAKGKLCQMSKIVFIMESGVGLMSGQGENPRILVEYSDDGGYTWKHGGWPRIGRLGERTLRVEFFDLGKFYDRTFRVSVSDPVPVYIYSATIDLRLVSND